MGMIRLALALSVMNTHSGVSILGLGLMPGYIAVRSFYIISGFYMAMILNEKYVRKGDYVAFLQQRFFRLYPTYFVVLLLCLLGDGLASHAHLIQHDNGPYLFNRLSELQPLSIVFLAATNLLILGQDIVMFLGVGPHGNLFFTPDFNSVPLPAWHFLIVPPAWSLGLEITFYLLAPFIVRRSVLFHIGLIIVSIALRLFFRFHFKLSEDPWSYRFFPFEIGFFLFGSLCYRAYAARGNFFETLAGRYGWIRWPFLLYLLTYSGAISRGVPIFLALCLLIPLFFIATKANPVDKFCGELSYPIYLCHYLTLSLMSNWVAFVPNWLQGVYYAAGALAVAVPICLWVDYPVERFRHSLKRYRQQEKAAHT